MQSSLSAISSSIVFEFPFSINSTAPGNLQLSAAERAFQD